MIWHLIKKKLDYTFVHKGPIKGCYTKDAWGLTSLVSFPLQSDSHPLCGANWMVIMYSFKPNLQAS